MPIRLQVPRFGTALVLMSALALGALALRGAAPKIDHIEFTADRKGVLLHFEVADGEMNCDVEYTTNLAGPWQLLRKFPKQGVNLHYVWPDFFPTNTTARFYRLRFYP